MPSRSFATLLLSILGAIAVASLVLSTVTFAWTAWAQPALLQRVVTDGGTLEPLQANRLRLSGLSGIVTGLDEFDDTIKIDNLRDMTPYTVDASGGSEYLTPQEAYAAAVADGMGGTSGKPAVIMIAPGVYDFGDTLFPITRSGIGFRAIGGEAAGQAGVIFTASAPTGGIRISIPHSNVLAVIFQGITFGKPSDAVNGFLLTHNSGSCILFRCAVLDSMTRFLVGGAAPGDLARFSAVECTLNGLPPHDMITSLDTSAVTFLRFCTIQQTGTGAAPVTNGGFIFNCYAGIHEARFIGCFAKINNYGGLFKGPGPTVVGGDASLTVSNSFVLSQGGNPQFDGLVISGNLTALLASSQFSLHGSLILHTENSSDTLYNSHSVQLSNSIVQTMHDTVLTGPNVTRIGIYALLFTNSALGTKTPLLINVPQAVNGTDVLDVTLVSCSVQTSGAVLSDYVLGPGSAPLAILRIGNSCAINGATGVTGFTHVGLPDL